MAIGSVHDSVSCLILLQKYSCYRLQQKLNLGIVEKLETELRTKMFDQVPNGGNVLERSLVEVNVPGI